jgi:RNA polymerase-binding transcription factor DksA
MAKKSTPAKSKSSSAKEAKAAAASKQSVAKPVGKKAAAAQKAVAKKSSAKKSVATKPSSQAKATKTAKKSAVKSVNKQTSASPKSAKSKSAKASAKPTPNPKPTTGLPITRVSLVKKATPVSFSLEDVEEVLSTRNTKGEISLESVAKPVVAPTPVKTEKTLVVDKLPIEKRKHGAASLMDILGFNPKEKKSPTDLAPDEVPAKWKRYYKLLLELREHVKAELDLHTAETLKHSTREDSGDLSGYAQHQADSATDSFDRDFALSLLSSEQDALYEIEEAIKRIRNGSYGRCEVTGEAIPKERLLAVPFTRFSIEGQREFEKNKRRKVERGTAFADNSDGVSLAGDDDDDD